jgi:hypothetical protein
MALQLNIISFGGNVLDHIYAHWAFYITPSLTAL